MSEKKAVFVTSLTGTSLTDVEGVGTIRDEGGKVYKYIKYDEGAATLDIVAGDFLTYLAVTGLTNHIATADVSDGDSVPIPAGVAMTAVTVTNTFMWIQVKGHATVAVTIGSGVDGELVAPLTTNKALTNMDMSVAVSAVAAGFAIDASAKTVYLNCPF